MKMSRIALIKLNEKSLVKLLNDNMPAAAKRIPEWPDIVKILYTPEDGITIAIEDISLPENTPGEKYPTLYEL
jgi:hypothetical protein